MKKKLFLMCFSTTLLFIISCGANKTTKPDSDYKYKSDNSMNSLDWDGVYTGVLPCADCEGIQTTIKLSKDLKYVIETEYLGKSNEIRNVTGTFKWTKSGNSIILDNADGNGKSSYYGVGENKLTALDQNGKPITDELAVHYILKKSLFEIVEKYWKLVEINGKQVGSADSLLKEPNMILKAADSSLIGSGGCNSFVGRYELRNGNRITFSNVAATKMACENMQVENQLFKVFESADNYTIKNDTLSLNKAKMSPLAKFQVVYLR